MNKKQSNMNPELEKYIPQIIQLHKQQIGSRLNWTTFPNNWNDLSKSDIRDIQLGLIKMGAIEYDPPQNTSYTRLIKHDFDIIQYKESLQKEVLKKWYDQEIAKQTFDDYPKVYARSKRAEWISILALIVTLITLMSKWLCNKPG